VITLKVREEVFDRVLKIFKTLNDWASIFIRVIKPALDDREDAAKLRFDGTLR
jgi:hypothetical protein